MAAQKETRVVELIINGKQAELSLNQIKGKVIQLTKELSRMKEADDPILYKQKAAELQKVNAAYKEMRAGITGATTANERFWSGMKQMAGGVFLGNLLTGAFEKLGAIIPDAIKSNADLSDSLSDVKKTTGLTTNEVENLNNQLKKINTRTSRKELLELARDAGKLGITGKEEILGFVKAANQINVALGEDLGEDAIKNIGKLVDIFQLTDEFGLETAMLKIGSTINELGMASTASEGFLVEFLKRMGGIAPLANVTAAEMLALGGTLDSLGQTSEVSSTALSKLFIKMASDAATYANIAGVSVQEFTDTLNNNALDAFIQVLEAAGSKDGGIVELTQTLGDLGIEGGRATGVFGTLANNTDRLKSQINLANKSFIDGVSITAEYNEKNNNLAATLEKISKWLNSAYNNSLIKKGIETMVAGVASLLGLTTKESEALQTQQVDMNILANRILEVNTNNTERIKLIEQLKSQYPEYFAMIDAETVSNIELKDAIKEANEMMVRRIALKIQEEALVEHGQKTNDYRQKAAVEELKVRKDLATLAQKNNIQVKDGLTLLEQAVDVYQQLPKDGLGGRLFSSRENFGFHIAKYQQWMDAVDEMSKWDAKMQADTDALAQKLGITDLSTGSTSTGKKVKDGTTITTVTETEEEKKAREDREKEYKKNTKKLIEELGELRAEGIKEEERREIALLHNKYQLRIKEVADMRANEKVKKQVLTAEKEGFERELTAIEYKHSKKRSDDEYDQSVEFLKRYYEKRKMDLDKSYLDGEISTEQYNDAMVDLEFEMLEAKLVLNRDYGKSVNDIEQDILDKKVNIKNEELAANQRTIDELERMSEEFDKNEKARADEAKKREEDLNAYKLRIAESSLDVIGALRQHKTTRELQALDAESIAFEKKQDKEKSTLKQQLSNELITQEKYDAAMTALEEEATEKQREIRKKQFYVEQESALAMARINLVKMVGQALVTPPGPPATIPFGIAAAVLGKIQIDEIKNTPIPNFFGGGVTVTGAMDGKRYNANTTGSFARGGAVNSATVGLIGEQGPELVIPNWLYTAPQTANLMRALEAAIYTKQFAVGGSTTNSTLPNANISNNNNELKIVLMQVQIALVKLDERLAVPITAKTLYNKQEYDDYIADDTKARDAGRF